MRMRRLGASSLLCQHPEDVGNTEDDFTWPAMCLQEGADTILHVFAQESNEGINPRALAYFRCVHQEAAPLPDVFYCVDTVNTLSQDCDCTDEGKVAIAWTANLPAPGDCDACSSHDHWQFTRRNSNLYYQISGDGGANWQPRVNVTKNVDGEEGFRPYADLPVLVDSRNYTHVVWNALHWPADAPPGEQV